MKSARNVRGSYLAINAASNIITFLAMATIAVSSIAVYIVNLLKFIDSCKASDIGMIVLHGIGVFTGLFSWISVWF
jgi:apolipoprotein N-acyltransferase